MKMEDTDLYKEIQLQAMHVSPSISIANLATVCELKYRHYSSPSMQKLMKELSEYNPSLSLAQVMRTANCMWHLDNEVVY